MQSTLDLVETFPAFTPYSAGSYEDKAQLTVEAINQLFPALHELVSSVGSVGPRVSNIDAMANSSRDIQSAAELKRYLDNYGSDKATLHDYHQLYGHILKHPDLVTGICEVGLGTNNTSVVSNMGAEGRPGASLRAFRDYCPRALVYGADIDRGILFEEERIWTGFVDQTDRSSLAALAEKVPDELDLVIDDGLHSPVANLNTLGFGLRKIKVGGWTVIEDISPHAVDLWEAVSMILPERFECYVFRARGGVVFAAKRLG